MTTMIHSAVQSNKETLTWNRDHAYRSMQSTQREWQQSKEIASESVTRDGVTLSLSAKGKTQLVKNDENQPLELKNRLAMNAEADTYIEVPDRNLTVIMDKVRELSIASSKDTVSEPNRVQMIKEMRQLIDEAEQINKRSRPALQGYVNNPQHQLKVQKASEAFRAQKELYAIEKS